MQEQRLKDALHRGVSTSEAVTLREPWMHISPLLCVQLLL